MWSTAASATLPLGELCAVTEGLEVVEGLALPRAVEALAILCDKDDFSFTNPLDIGNSSAPIAFFQVNRPLPVICSSILPVYTRW